LLITKLTTLLTIPFRSTDRSHNHQPVMKFTSNCSNVGRIIDTLSYNRVTDLDGESMSPFLHKTMFGNTSTLRNSMKGLGKSKNYQTAPEANINDSKSINSSFAQFKYKSSPHKLTPLSMTQQQNSIVHPIKGRDLRPELHHKTYFKAQASAQINSGPKIRLPSTANRFTREKVNLTLRKDNLVLPYGKRESRQVYDSER
jgi:hypothetical protein